MTAGRATGISRLSGFTWVLEWEDWSGPGATDAIASTEVGFVTLSPPSAHGGEYTVYHEATDGSWFAYELWGYGPMVMDREIEGEFPSPLEAMRACRKDYTEQVEIQERAEREIDRFAEEERARELEYQNQIRNSQGYF